MFLVQREAVLMEVVWTLSRSWTFDTYVSLYRAIHPGGNVLIPVALKQWARQLSSWR